MPYIIGASVSDGSTVSMDFEPEIDGRLMARLTLGRSTPEERAAIPPVLVIGTPRMPRVPEIIGWGGGPFLVCPRLRELLEQLEPGRHESVPVAIRTRSPFHGKTEHGSYHLLLPPPRIPAVIIEETEFRGGFGRAGFNRDVHKNISSVREDPCVLDADVIAGHHLWQLPEEFSPPTYFCSDELWRWIKAQKFKGWSIRKKCSVKKRIPR